MSTSPPGSRRSSWTPGRKRHWGTGVTAGVPISAAVPAWRETTANPGLLRDWGSRNDHLVELLGRYSNWTSWANRARTIDQTAEGKPELRPCTRGTARQLSEDEVTELVISYQAGATVYDLATRFKIHRTTVSQHLHRRGAAMRGLSLHESRVDLATRLYEPGLVIGSDR